MSDVAEISDEQLIRRELFGAAKRRAEQVLAPDIRTLYVHRQLINGAEVAAWAKQAGFPTTLEPDDMHVTVAFSRDTVDWNRLTPRNDTIRVGAGERSLEVLGIEKDAVVLRFESDELAARWQDFKDAGASWDWPGYKPHVTISYNGQEIDIAKIAPYDGALHFGPEVFAEVDDDWKSKVDEKDWDEGDHPRDEDGKFTFGGGGDEGGGGSVSSGDGAASSGTSVQAYSKATHSDHVGLSSDFDMRPGNPMAQQSIIATVKPSAYAFGVSSEKPAHKFINTEVMVNPSASWLKNIIGQDEPARVMQDRAGNLFAWPSDQVIHQDMMDALEPVDTMWATDSFAVENGKIVSETAPGTDKAKEWIEHGQSNSKTAKETTTVGFVSPNVRSDLDFSGAVQQLKSDQQASLLAHSAAVDRGLKITAKESSVVGAWADGAENSIMMTAASDWDHGVLSMALKGWMADQKSVLVFQQQDGGTAKLVSYHANGDLETVHKELLEDGVAFHTLVPTKDGATVYVTDLDDSAFDAIKRSTERYGSQVTVQRGRAEFIGDTEGTGSDREQRDRARSVYERVIQQSKVEGKDRVWSDLRDWWSKAREGTVAKEFNEDDHPRDEDNTTTAFQIFTSFATARRR